MNVQGLDAPAGEHARRAAEALALLAQTGEGAVAVDRRGLITWISPKYRRLLGLGSDAAVVGQPVDKVIPESRLLETMDSGLPVMLDIMRFGHRHFVVCRVPLRDAGGVVDGAAGFVFYDRLDYLEPLIAKFRELEASLNNTRAALARELKARHRLSSFVGVSEAVRAVKDLARQFAARQGAVLIQGETGVGKELLAHALHLASPRADGPFVAVNMAGVAQGMLEAELFGAAAGHGAPRPGKFELAHRGTLFLDEVGDMPLAMQARLLRVLQDGEFEPVGVAQTKAVDVRIIAATGQELEAKVREGTFRRDLFFRLNVLPLRLPPLRERPQDIEALCEAILDDLQPPHDAGGAWLLTPQACALLRQQPWPGNVRQLRNVLEHAAARSAGRVLDTEEIAQALQGGGSFAASAQQAAQHGDYSLAQALVETERTAIERALHVAQGSKSQAASLLGISRSQLYVKLRRHRIPV